MSRSRGTAPAAEGLPLFVYGTLKTGEAQAGLLGGLARRPATLRGRMYHLPAGYPAVTLEEADQEVHGELVDPPGARRLALLDGYEGVDEGLFSRVEVDVVVGLRAVRAWVYTMDAPRLRGGIPVAGGRWTAPARR